MNLANLPYCGGPPLPADIWTRWNLDPFLLLGLIAAMLIGRGLGARAAPLGTGLAILFVIFVSPLCALASSLFALRVTHHVVLTGLAAPLFAVAMARSRGGGVATWTAVHAGIFWFWHLPASYAAALASDAAYWAMQASLLASAIGLWRAVFSAPRHAAVAGLLATSVQMGLLGALLTFSTVPLYAWHGMTTQAWGLLPMADQQLAGLIMWVAGGAVYLLAALRIANGWFGRDAGLPA